jgi:rubrerythrin
MCGTCPVCGYVHTEADVEEQVSKGFCDTNYYLDSQTGEERWVCIRCGYYHESTIEKSETGHFF